MHGIINRGLQNFVHDYYGAGKWEEICVAADLPFYSFESMLQYDDDITRRLLEALSDVLNRRKEHILEDFGTYAVTDARMAAILRLLRFGGTSFVDFLLSLEDVCERVKVAMPMLEVPRLSLEMRPGNVYCVHYEFTRPGYGAVLLGLLRAMADDYDALVTIDRKSRSNGPIERDSFEIHVHDDCWRRSADIRRIAS